MEKWQADLISEVTACEEFSSQNRDRDRELLEYLVAHSSRSAREMRSEHHLRHFWPSDYGGNIQTNIGRLADRLHRYFASEKGRSHRRCIEILRGSDVHPDDTYSVRFPSNPSALVRVFWGPYVETSSPTLIIYGVPLFIRSADNKLFTRMADWNIEADVERSVTGEFCWPFVAHGDLQAAIELNRWLAQQGVSVDFADQKADSRLADVIKGRLMGTNVIALGSTRSNGILGEYQALQLHDERGLSSIHLPFRLGIHDVVHCAEGGEDLGEPIQDKKSGPVTEVPVVITRRHGAIRGNSTVTLIASNHGRAVHQSAAILTDDDQINTLFANDRLQRWREDLPAQFQIVLRVEVFEGEQVSGEFSVVDAWAAE